jgi:hypothetical protein
MLNDSLPAHSAGHLPIYRWASEVDGAWAAEGLLALVTERKGAPLMKQEIAECASAGCAERCLALLHGQISRSRFADWCKDFVFACKLAEDAAPGPRPTSAGLIKPVELVTAEQAIIAFTREFGVFLHVLRERSHIPAADVIAALVPESSTLDRQVYIRIEAGRRVPQFADLSAIYQALLRSGVEIQPAERAAYLALAQKQVMGKGSRRESTGAAQWETLATQLAALHQEGEAR